MYETLNLSEKIKVVEEVERDMRKKKKGDIEKQYGIAPNTFSTYFKDKDKILTTWAQQGNGERKRARKPNIPTLKNAF